MLLTNLCLGLPLDTFPDNVPHPVEGPDASRPPDVAVPDQRSRNEEQGGGDIPLSRVPGKY